MVSLLGRSAGICKAIMSWLSTVIVSRGKTLLLPTHWGPLNSLPRLEEATTRRCESCRVPVAGSWLWQ